MKILMLPLFIVLLLQIGLVSAVDFTPQGDINLRDTYYILNNPSTSCPSGQLVQGINVNGSWNCSSAGSGDITEVLTTGDYITGGATSGSVSLLLNETILNSSFEIYSSLLNVNRSDYWDGFNNPLDIITLGNFTAGISYFTTVYQSNNLILDNTSDLDSDNIVNYPVPCSAGYYMTQFLGANQTCTRAVRITGDNMTSNYSIDGNLNVSDTTYVSSLRSMDSNSIYIQPTGDTDDYFSFKTVAHRPTIKREGGKYIYFESSNVYDVGVSFRADDTYSGTVNYEKDNHVMTLLGKNSPIGLKPNSGYNNYILFETYDYQPYMQVYNGTLLIINDSLEINGSVNSSDGFRGTFNGTFNGGWNNSYLYRSDSWNNLTGIPHATPSNGDITHFSLAAEIYDWVVATFQPLETTLTDIADGTIAENLINTANPWADNEVSDTLTVTGYMQDEDINTFSELQSWVADESLLKAGTLTNGKVCKYDSASTDVICNYDDVDTDTNAKTICSDNEVLLGQASNTCINLNNTIDDRGTGGSGGNTTEEMQDAVLPALNTGTQTHITVTYQDITDDVDFVVADDWYDSVGDIPTATPSNGDTTHLSTADHIYDYIVSLAYKTLSEIVVDVGNWSSDKVSYWNESSDLSDDEIAEAKIGFSTACGPGNHYYLNGNDLDCEADADTTYTENSPYLSLTSTTFSFVESYLNNTIDDRDTDTQDLSYDTGTDVISLVDGGSIDITEVDTDTHLTEDQTEAYIFDNDNNIDLNMSYHNITTVDCIKFSNGAKWCGVA